MPEPFHLKPQTGQDLAAIDAIAARRDRAVNAILSPQIELSLSPFRVQQPIFRDTTLLILRSFR